MSHCIVPSRGKSKELPKQQITPNKAKTCFATCWFSNNEDTVQMLSQRNIDWKYEG